MAERSASRAALLALKRERRIIEEGHRFLDERRVALAHELLRRTRQYEERRAALLIHAAEARRALGDAVGRHGLEGLQVYPAVMAQSGEVKQSEAVFLGLRLVTAAQWQAGATARPAGALPSAEATRCAEAFQAVAQEAAAIAADVASLFRLMAEYRRTERRVRAIENIVLPEARADERRFENALEEVDQEEVMRSRLFAREDFAGAA